MDYLGLTGKRVVVTGAARGIGRAVFEAFLAAGAEVIGTATSAKGVESIAEMIRSARGAQTHQSGALMLHMGVETTFADYAEWIAECTTLLGGSPDILVNNAGITRDNLALRLSEEEWDAVLAVNLKAAFGLSKAVLRGMMKARWGRIIHMSSVVAGMGNPGQPNYCAAKAGLEGLTRSLAMEYGGRGITVNAIAPGFIESDMTHGLEEAHKAALLTRIPNGRMGQGADIAAAALFLASPGAGYIQGHVLAVNGGLWMG